MYKWQSTKLSICNDENMIAFCYRQWILWAHCQKAKPWGWWLINKVSSLAGNFHQGYGWKLINCKGNYTQQQIGLLRVLNGVKGWQPNVICHSKLGALILHMTYDIPQQVFSPQYTRKSNDVYESNCFLLTWWYEDKENRVWKSNSISLRWMGVQSCGF